MVSVGSFGFTQALGTSHLWRRESPNARDAEYPNGWFGLQTRESVGAPPKEGHPQSLTSLGDGWLADPLVSGASTLTMAHNVSGRNEVFENAS